MSCLIALLALAVAAGGQQGELSGIHGQPVDGHDVIAAVLQYRRTSADAWRETPMTLASPGLDEWEYLR